MNEHAHTYAPAPDAPAAPMAPPAAPPAPPAPIGFAMPTDPAAALDVTVPLVPVQPSAPAMQAAASPAMPAAPQLQPYPGAPMHSAAPAEPHVEQVMPAAVNFAALAAAPAEPVASHAFPHGDHPTSLAMPAQAAGAMHVQAMPEQLQHPSTPGEIGGVAAASPQDLADLHAAAGLEHGTAPVAPAWTNPGLALVVAMFALTFQLIAFYAREVLPGVKAAGATMVRFDEVVDALPLIGGTVGSMFGMLLGVAGLVLVLLGVRAGIREPVLQGAIGVLAGLALAATVLLPVVAG